jgi:hypothetical protein
MLDERAGPRGLGWFLRLGVGEGFERLLGGDRRLSSGGSRDGLGR